MFERLKAMLHKEFRQVLRDPRMRAVIFIMPVVQMLVFSYAATTDVKDITTAVYDLDRTPQSRELLRAFEYSRYFRIVRYISSDAEQKADIDASRVSTVIRFNHGFGADILAKRRAQVQIIIDGTDSNTAAVILGYANRIVERYSYSLLRDRAAVLLRSQGGFPKVDLNSRAWFNENLESRNFYIPGVISLMITLLTLLLTSMAIVREKEIGTMEQLMVSPLRSYELILGKLLPFAIIGLVDVVLITTIGVLWFHVPVRGNLLLLFGSTSAYLLTSLGVGLFISTISNTQQEAMMSVFLFFFPANLLSGFMFPIANMPPAVQLFTYLNPLRYFIIILRGLFLKGVGLEVLWPQIAALLVMGAAILTVSSLRFRKRLG
jgi:ABC-2 type transport system permease protein